MLDLYYLHVWKESIMNEERFSLSGGTSSLDIYDMRGQMLEKLSVTDGQASWLPKKAGGRYFAKAIYEKREIIQGFTTVR